MGMKQVCIICSKEACGIAVADTRVIRAIRAVKRKFNMAANNRLLVCHECMEEYKKRRKSFERKVMLYGAIGIILIILSVAMPLMGGGNISPASVFMVLLLAVFLLALAFLSYIPALAPSAQEESAHSHAQENSAHHAHAPAKKVQTHSHSTPSSFANEHFGHSCKEGGKKHNAHKRKNKKKKGAGKKANAKSKRRAG